MPYIFGKLWHLAIIWAIRKAFQCIPQGVRFLLAKQTRLSGTSDNESYLTCVPTVLSTFLLSSTSSPQSRGLWPFRPFEITSSLPSVTLMLGFSPLQMESLLVITSSWDIGSKDIVSRAWLEMWFICKKNCANFEYPVFKMWVDVWFRDGSKITFQFNSWQEMVKADLSVPYKDLWII